MNIFDQLMGKERRKVQTTVEKDIFVEKACEAFDYTFDGVIEFELWDMPEVPTDFTLGMIVGDSGTGKSFLLKDFGEEHEPKWNRDKAIVSHFSDPDTAINRLMSVGLNTIHSWLKPYHVLSFGEQYRAKVARGLKDNAVFDEFTSVVDRDTAKSLSVSVRRFIDREKLKGVVVATCHEDIIEWLQPDWVFNTNTGELSVGRSLRPPIKIQIYRSDTSLWGMFAEFHYLTEDINKASQCYLAMWEGKPIGFMAVMPLPSGTVKNGVRGHRLVILPKYQGLGVGVRLSQTVAQHYVDQGKRYFSRTAHPRMGQYREESPLYRPTSKNRVKRTEKFVTMSESFHKNANENKGNRARICYCHEYVGRSQK